MRLALCALALACCAHAAPKGARAIDRALGEVVDRAHAAGRFRVVSEHCGDAECWLQLAWDEPGTAQVHVQARGPRASVVSVDCAGAAPEICPDAIWQRLTSASFP
jgi:hypothetical protein